MCVFSKKSKETAKAKPSLPFHLPERIKKKKQSLETNYDIKHARFII